MDQIHDEIQARVIEILEKNTPKHSYRSVTKRNDCFGGKHLRILIAASDFEINRVQGQLPQLVSLNLDLEKLELETCSFGGNGGGSIYRKPNKEDSKERFLAMKSIKIPFRKPKCAPMPVMNAIETFAQRWTNLLIENKDQLCYQQEVDYNNLLNL